MVVSLAIDVIKKKRRKYTFDSYILVPILVLLLFQSLKTENQFYFGPAINPLTENFYVANRVHRCRVRC